MGEIERPEIGHRILMTNGERTFTASQIREVVERVKEKYVWSNHNMMSEHGSKETEWALGALDALAARLEAPHE